MKRIVALVLCLILLAATGAQAIVDLGHPAVTRLWTTDNKYACTATYIREARPGVAWILSAGHCRAASYTKRNAFDNILGGIDWRVVIETHAYAEKVYDLAIGTVPDVRDEKDRKYYPYLADKFPDSGRVYIHGFPTGIETVAVGYIVGPSKEAPGSYEVRMRNPGDVLPGSSGSAVLNSEGYIVGILWGLHADPFTHEPTDRAVVTPIEAFHAVTKTMGLKL